MKDTRDSSILHNYVITSWELVKERKLWLIFIIVKEDSCVQVRFTKIITIFIFKANLT